MAIAAGEVAVEVVELQDWSAAVTEEGAANAEAGLDVFEGEGLCWSWLSSVQ